MSGATRLAGFDGPYFDELQVGLRVQSAPSVTLTAAHGAVHQSILGDRLRLALDANLSAAVVGPGGVLAHPALVWDVAIGQSTLLTRQVIANLFYRGLTFHRAPIIGDTLHTTTEVVALRQNRARADRDATGLAVLRITTVDQDERLVLDFLRCAMLPLSDPRGTTRWDDDLDQATAGAEPPAFDAAVSRWRLPTYRGAVDGPHFDDVSEGDTWLVAAGDVVSSAPELARLTLNVAAVHHDWRRSRKRLVYGGHTIGLAAAQLTRALPALVTIVGWHSCDHVSPVFEGDTLTSDILLERRESLPEHGGLVHLRCRVQAHRDVGATDVLDWRLIGVMA